MAWNDAYNMGSAFPILDYGANQLAKYGNEGLFNPNDPYAGLSSGQQVFRDGIMGAGVGNQFADARQRMTSNDAHRGTFPGQRSPHTGFEEMEFDETVQAPERTGFLSGITGPVMGGLKWLGDKFKRSPEKQAAYDAITGGQALGTGQWTRGMYGGNEYDLYNSPSGLKVGSEIIGRGPGFEKNFDSMFGSKSLEEMEQKKLDWAAERLRTGKGLSKRLRDILKQRGITGDASKTDIAPITTTTGATTPNVHGGGDAVPSGRHDYTRDRGGGYTLGGGFTGTRGQVGRTGSTAGTGRGHHSWRAEGGRVGLRLGGDPDEPAENMFEFMRDQGINYDQTAEGVEQKFLSDELGAIDVDEETLAMITDLLGKEADVSTISTLTGKDEGTIERVIRVLTTQSQAQGGSVGFFDGGLASLV